MQNRQRSNLNSGRVALVVFIDFCDGSPECIQQAQTRCDTTPDCNGFFYYTKTVGGSSKGRKRKKST